MVKVGLDGGRGIVYSLVVRIGPCRISNSVCNRARKHDWGRWWYVSAGMQGATTPGRAIGVRSGRDAVIRENESAEMN